MCKPINLPRRDKGSPFDIFDLTSLTWSVQPTFGIPTDVPDLGIGSTLSYHKGTHSMYLYGGWNDRLFSSDVFCVSLDTWQWKKITVPEGDIKPSPRYLTGVLLHEDRLCNFGGVGPKIVDGQDIGAEYCGCVEGNTRYAFGWNNEYYEFDLIKCKFVILGQVENVSYLFDYSMVINALYSSVLQLCGIHVGKWEAPMSGDKQKWRPPPMGGNMFMKFDGHRAVNFGGRTEKGKVNDLYIFNLDKKVRK